MSNKVKYLQTIDFSKLKLNEQLEIKALGRPMPNLNMQKSGTSRTIEYKRQFHSNIYEKYLWVCGCEESNSLFCYPCLLYGGDILWTETGVTDLRSLPQKIKKHEQSSKHIQNVLSLTLLGSNPCPNPLNLENNLEDIKHNEVVRRNRKVLFRIINCLKFCGEFNLHIQGLNHCDCDNGTQLGPNHSDAEGGTNVFKGVVEYLYSMDSSSKLDLYSVEVLQGLSQQTLNKLFDAMLQVCQDHIKEEISNAEYLAVMCDDIIDVCDKMQVAVVLRYMLNGKPVERFWGFFNPVNRTVDALTEMLQRELYDLIPDCPNKLIAQTYDGAVRLSVDKTNVHSLLKERYKNAHFIHCYSHEHSGIIQKATWQNGSMKVFFNDISRISTFFSRPEVLEKILCQMTVPSNSHFKGNHITFTINTIHAMKDTLKVCSGVLETLALTDIGTEATAIKRIFHDENFDFWLSFFSKVMPHIEQLFSQFEYKSIDVRKATISLSTFYHIIKTIRSEYEEVKENGAADNNKPSKYCPNKIATIEEVCDIILLKCSERLSFINHLEASKLLVRENFISFLSKFPNYELSQAVDAYPMLDKEKLGNELSVLYTRSDIYHTEKLTDLLRFFYDKHLQSTFCETVKLIKILLTTPMITDEPERCFKTLKKIKRFLKQPQTIDNLTALAMVSLECTMVKTKIPDFNDRVIDCFVTVNCFHEHFMYRQTDTV
ncbi:Hypothetical predicted protein [Argonauta hians]